jgi:hypothetical protein
VSCHTLNSPADCRNRIDIDDLDYYGRHAGQNRVHRTVLIATATRPVRVDKQHLGPLDALAEPTEGKTDAPFNGGHRLGFQLASESLDVQTHVWAPLSRNSAAPILTSQVSVRGPT